MSKDIEYKQTISAKDEEISIGVRKGLNEINNNSNIKNITADYIQPWYVSDWQETDFDNYFEKIKENHMDTCILQYCAKINIENGEAYFSEIYFYRSDNNPYKSAIEAAKTLNTSTSSEDTLGNLIKSAKKNNIKVFIGLADSDSYFDEDFKDATWRTKIVDLNNILSSYLISEYKDTYPNTFEGIYIPFEFYTNSNNYEQLYWADMIDNMRTHIKSIEPNYLQSMPVMISTYCSQLDKYIINETQMENGIRQLASALQEGDIICTQDKIATNYNTSFDYNLKYLKAVRNVINTIKNTDNVKLQYWINVETFYPIPNPSTNRMEAASTARVKDQIKLASKYSDKIAMFSYAHYYLSKENNEIGKSESEKEFYDAIDSLTKSKIKSQYGNMEIKYFDDGSYVPIPDGFYYITGDLQTGVVISDNPNDRLQNSYVQLDGNQFVWIPIDVTKFVRDKFKFDINLSDESTANSYWEDNDLEYNKMYDSIIKHEGFYVARYETCIIEDQVRYIAGQYVKNNVTLQNAKNYCNTLYPNSNSVKTHVLYGIEWDSMLNTFIGKTDSYNNDNKMGYSLLRESQNYGNYGTISNHGSQKLTGDTPTQNAQIYHIFDLAGNFWEITQENYGNLTNGVLRGRKLLGIWK